MMDASVNAAFGELEIATVANLATNSQTDFVAVHPDGTVRYTTCYRRSRLRTYIKWPSPAATQAKIGLDGPHESALSDRRSIFYATRM